MTTKEPKPKVDEAAWEALAHGELSDEEAGFLRALAEADPTLEQHAAAYTPVSPAFVDKLVRDAETSLARHRQRRRGLFFGASAGTLAAAAAILLMFRVGTPGGEAAPYQLRIAGGATLERGTEEPSSTPRFEADTQLEIVAVPASRRKDEVEVRAYLVQGEHLERLEVDFERSPGGGLRWRGPASKLLRRGPGRYRVALVVGSELPSEAETRRWVEQGDRRVIVGDVEFLGPEAALDRESELRFASIDEAREAGRLDEAETALQPLLGSAEPAVRIRALGLVPRISAARGRLDQALHAWSAAAQEARRAGFEQRALDGLLVRADWLRRKTFRLAEAERALDEIERDFPEHPGARSLVAYQRGMCASEAGDVGRGLRALETARERAHEGPYERALALGASEVEAVLLNALGRAREAQARLEAARAWLGEDPCEQAGFLTNVGWLSLMAAERGAGPIDQASLERAYTLFTQHDCDRSYARNAAINLALAAVSAGDLASAERWLKTAREHADGEEPTLASWSLDVAGRVALGRGDTSHALSLYRELEARTAVAGEPGDRWRAATGLGRALAASGDRGAAREAYLRAERLLDEETAAIPFHAGRETFSGTRDASAHELALLELRDGAAEAAYRVLRHARARALRQLSLHDASQRLLPEGRARLLAALEVYKRARESLEAHQAEAFTAPLDELPALDRKVIRAREDARTALDRAVAELGPLPSTGEPLTATEGELIVALFPFDDAWLAFAESQKGVRHARLTPPAQLDERKVVEHVLRPFARELAQARRLRLLPYGHLRSLDWHALPYQDRPLIERMPVVYGADLAGTAGAPRASRAVVVSDPRGNLGRARDEGRAVAALLRARGVTVTLLEGEAATREALEPALEHADLLHVAAHAEGPRHSRRLGGILLAHEDRLDVGDVLALEHAPRRVVLSTCEGALEPDEAKLPGLGIAQAFLARGSDEVVASTRKVPDDFAKAFALALYAAPEDDLGSRLQHAVREVRADTPDAEHWKSYRTWVR